MFLLYVLLCRYAFLVSSIYSWFFFLSQLDACLMVGNSLTPSLFLILSLSSSIDTIFDIQWKFPKMGTIQTLSPHKKRWNCLYPRIQPMLCNRNLNLLIPNRKFVVCHYCWSANISSGGNMYSKKRDLWGKNWKKSKKLKTKDWKSPEITNLHRWKKNPFRQSSKIVNNNDSLLFNKF